jgi:magnesium transporter
MSKRNKHRKIGLPPGTLVYTGTVQTEASDVTVIQYDVTAISEKILMAHPDKNGRGGDECISEKEGMVTWYDVRGLSDVALIERIGHHFKMHQLAIEDVLNTQQRPKWEDYHNGIFLVTRAQRLHATTHEIITEQIAFFFGHNFLITFQEDKDDLFPNIRERLHKSMGKIRQKGADYLAYALIDYIVDEYFLILDKTEEMIESLENQILNDFRPTVRNNVYNLKRKVSEVRRAVFPLREVIGRFVREESNFVDSANNVFIRDLYDHVTQLVEILENQRDMLQNLNDLYNAEQSNRANHVMKVLTIVSAIFIPLTFLAGVYGMNFHYLPELDYHYGYFIFWAVIILIAILQLIYFKKKKWL